MTSSVITISRSLGAGGEEVGHIVATNLGYTYVDDQIITEAAERAGVSPEAVARAEAPKPLIDRILDSFARTQVASPEAFAAGFIDLSGQPAMERLIEQVIRETARRGNVVILAHAASVPLAGIDGLLRVNVTASPPVRAARLVRGGGLSDADAAKAIADSDRARAGYFRRFYNTDESDTLYDVVLNTDVLSPAQAADLVRAAARLL